MAKRTGIIFTTVLFLGLGSCEVFESLDELPPNQLVEENLFVSSEAAEAVLNGTYEELLSEGYFGAMTFPSRMSSDMEDLRSGGTQIFSSNDYELTEMYGSFYTLVNRANNVIQGVNGMEALLFVDNRKNEILGEAHFLRAMGHFDALRLFGHFFDINSDYGAIIRELPVVLGNKEKARSAVRESYDLILSDLDFAMVNAPENNGTNFANRATSKALKARVLLYLAAANDHDVQTYQEAIALANDALAEGGYALDADYPDIFGGDSPEMVFETFEPQRSRILNRTVKFLGADSQRFYASKAFSDFMASDPRAESIIEPSNYASRDIIIKYGERDVLFLARAAELLLISAEAHARLQNDEQAKIDLNKIRQSRGLPEIVDETGNALMSLVYEEIRRDLNFENGHEWFALVRQGLETVTQASPGIISENLMALPIPTKEILNNTLMEQNPGHTTVITN